jgi:hypothetical protein
MGQFAFYKQDRPTPIAHLFGYAFTFFLGGLAVAMLSFPFEYLFTIFYGMEVRSEASFPRYHMARIYSAPGIGDQQLVFEVNGRRVYRTPDWVPGNVNEDIVWDESARVVAFWASGQKVYSYDTQTGNGWEEAR